MKKTNNSEKIYNNQKIKKRKKMITKIICIIILLFSIVTCIIIGKHIYNMMLYGKDENEIIVETNILKPIYVIEAQEVVEVVGDEEYKYIMNIKNYNENEVNQLESKCKLRIVSNEEYNHEFSIYVNDSRVELENSWIKDIIITRNEKQDIKIEILLKLDSSLINTEIELFDIISMEVVVEQ